MISLWPLGTVSWECPPPFRMAPSSCQHLDPPLPHLTCLRERPNLHMGTRTMRGWPRAWAVSYTQSRCITWALPERPEMLDTLLFSIKRDARNLAGRAQKLPPARLLPCYDRARLRSSWRIIATFEVLGARGDMNKSTFGTEDKCNPLEAIIGAALRYQTLRSLTATEIGAAPRRRHVTQGGGGRCE